MRNETVHPGTARRVAEERGLLTSVAVCRLTGLTYRQLDYRVRSGLLTPVVEAAGQGSARLWAPEVVDIIKDLEVRIAACPFSPHRGGHH